MIAPILFLFAEGKPSLFKCVWPTLGSSEFLVLIPFIDRIRGNMIGMTKHYIKPESFIYMIILSRYLPCIHVA